MRKNSYLLLIAPLLAASCFKPHYVRPHIDTPCSWRYETDSEASSLCNQRWWEQLQDPVLNELIAKALRNNKDLKVALYRVEQYYARFHQALAPFFPAFGVDAAFNRQRSTLGNSSTLNNFDQANGMPPTPNNGVGGIKSFISNNYQLFFVTSWELDFWGRIRSSSEAAYAELLAEVEGRRAAVLSLVAAVANGYITLRELDGQKEVSWQTLQSRLESLQLAKDRFDLGETSEIEVKQAEAEVQSAAIRYTEFERAIPQQENLLSVLIGENPHTIPRGVSINNFHYPLDIPTSLPSELLTRRPDIMRAEELLIAANARITEARALYFPQISLTGLIGSESLELKNFLNSATQLWQYSVNALMPLFTGGAIYSKVEEAAAVRQQALYNYSQVILRAFAEVDDALIAYQKNKELVLQHKKQVAILQDYLLLARLRYGEGEIDYLNVLDAERSLFDAALQSVAAQAESFTALVALYKALGGGWVDAADAEALAPNTFNEEPPISLPVQSPISYENEGQPLFKAPIDVENDEAWIIFPVDEPSYFEEGGLPLC